MKNAASHNSRHPFPCLYEPFAFRTSPREPPSRAMSAQHAPPAPAQSAEYIPQNPRPSSRLPGRPSIRPKQKNRCNLAGNSPRNCYAESRGIQTKSVRISSRFFHPHFAPNREISTPILPQNTSHSFRFNQFPAKTWGSDKLITYTPAHRINNIPTKTTGPLKSFKNHPPHRKFRVTC